MKRSINSLLDYTIQGTDGDIGKVEEFYFDDRTSTIRYIVVKTGGWFSEKKVLISPEAFLNADWESETLSVNLTQETIKNSPDIDTDKPFSQQQEEFLRGYYTWPGYYGPGMYGYWGLGMWGYPILKATKPEKEIKQEELIDHGNNNPHLRSTHEVTGYGIDATDGDIGKVVDFIFDDITWKIHFLVVETGSWFSEKKVLFSPERIKTIDWKNGTLIIDTTKARVMSSPGFDPKEVLTDQYEAALSDHYVK